MSIRPNRARDSWLLTGAVLVAAMLLSHPYTGIRHDGILYFGDALARISPGEFHDDLYFYYGSQGRFTLLPALYGWLIATFGIGGGTIVGLLSAQALQIAATVWLVAAFTPRHLRIYAALSVVLGWSIYGGLRIFAYGEAFLTSRSFAEPAVLFGLGLVVRDRRIAGAIVLAAAVAIHPLMGIGGLVVGWLWLCFQDRRWAWLAVVALLCYGVLGWWGRPPFDDVFARYDETWYALVFEANPHAFIGRWGFTDFGEIGLATAILWLAARRVGGALAPIAWAAIVGGWLCVGISGVAVDVLHNPFLGKLQIWRAVWLTQWFAMAVFPTLVVTLWTRGNAGRIAALLFVIGWMAPFSVAPAIVAVLALAVDAVGDRVVLTRPTVHIVGGLTAAVGIVITGQYWARTVKLGLLVGSPWTAIAGQMLAMNLALAVAAYLALRAARVGAFAGGIVVALLLVAGAAAWDERNAWTHRLESYPAGSSIWPGLIAPDARVYWYRDLIAPWILLGHANYYTQQQGSGAVFSRDMMAELDKRRKVTAILDFQEQICRLMNNLNEKESSCEPDAEAVKNVCVDGGIDYVVLQSGLDGAHAVADYRTGVVENGYEKRLFLYRCGDLNPR